MKCRVSILPRARIDVDRNALWWAENHSVEQVLQWSDAIYDQIESLAEFPESYGLSAENDTFPYEIRDKLLGLGSRPSYRAVFTIQDDAVYVLAVRRSTQDAICPTDIDAPPIT
jgi:plasmid stabilization system protein ParE